MISIWKRIQKINSYLIGIPSCRVMCEYATNNNHLRSAFNFILHCIMFDMARLMFFFCSLHINCTSFIRCTYANIESSTLLDKSEQNKWWKRLKIHICFDIKSEQIKYLSDGIFISFESFWFVVSAIIQSVFLSTYSI